MITTIAIIAGGFGALARHGVRIAVQLRTRSDRPLGTAVANIAGAAALGVLVGSAPGSDVIRIAGLGFLGGFTTFSTWMVEAWALTEGHGPHPVWFTWDVAGVLASGWGAYALALALGG